MSAPVSVWAPRASTVELVTGDGRVAMVAEPGGWFTSPRALPPGTRYALSLDGGEPMADPRSHAQPDGVAGWSMVVDHDAFAWTDRGWRGPPLAGSVIYELHVGTFSPEGTFDGAIARLDHLVALGVDLVEVMPIAEFSGRRGWGYDGVFWYAPHHAYGGTDGFKRFVDAAHGRGLGVVLDVVYNHFGPEGNVTWAFGPYVHDAHHTPWGEAVNLDGAGAPAVRRFIIDNARHWIERYHVDGLRLDAVHALVDDSAVHVLEQLAEEVRRLEAHLHRRVVLVAESDRNDPRYVQPPAAGGYGLDGVWADDLHHALHALVTGEVAGYYEGFGSVETVADALAHVYVHRRTWSPSRRRMHGRDIGAVGRDHFVVCLQNHDQVGNRAGGERIDELADARLVEAASALVLLGPATPLLFQGEEWGSTSPFPYVADFEGAELVEAVRRGRREEFAAFDWDEAQVPDPFDDATFDRARLRWDELAEGPHAERLRWYRSLIGLRRAWPDLTDGRADATQARAVGEAVVLERGRLSVLVNFGAEPCCLPERLGPVPADPGAPPPAAAAHVLLTNGDAERHLDGTVSVGPRTVVVLGPVE